MDWTKAQDDVAKHIVQEGHCYLREQLRMALSSDLRATGFVVAFATAEVMVTLFIMTVANMSMAEKFPLLVGGVVIFSFLWLGIACCVSCLFPKGFWLSGSEPLSWQTDVEEAKPLEVSLVEEINHIQDKISENRSISEHNIRLFRIGVFLGVSAPFFGIIAWQIAAL